jgi:hypothetical protein
MYEDQLTREERIRLEALNQAHQATVTQRTSTSEAIQRAQYYEAYIRGDDQ